jgi:hypothetical protein
MAFKQLDERTLISDSYTPFGELPQLPDRPDDPAKWRTNWLKEAEVKRLCRFSDAQFETARALGFPKPRTMQSTSVFSKRWNEWREEDVRTWLDRVRSLGVK